MMYNKALVTGGAGFIGSHLTDALLARGLEVTVLDDLSTGKPENVPQNAGFIVGDIRSQKDMDKALAGVDVVFHEAARVSIRASIKQFYEDADANLMGTLELLRCCAKHGVQKLVYASSMAVYADREDPTPIGEGFLKEPISPYGISKLAAEKYCRLFAKETGISCHVLRYFNTYGTRQAFTPYVGVITIFISRLLQGRKPVIFGDGRQVRDFVNVKDVVAANLLCLDQQTSSGTFNIGSSQGTSMNDLAAILCSKINPNIQPVHAEEHPGELKYSVADIRHANRELGFRPSMRLTEDIDDVIEYYRQ